MGAAVAAAGYCDADQVVAVSGSRLRQTLAFNATAGAQPCQWTMSGSQTATLFLEGLQLGSAHLSV